MHGDGIGIEPSHSSPMSEVRLPTAFVWQRVHIASRRLLFYGVRIDDIMTMDIKPCV